MAQPVFKNPLEAVTHCDDPALLESFATDISDIEGHAPTQILYPSSREDVQAIIAEATRSGTPLIPVSSGPPHFHGDTVPLRGGVIVDFSRMNKVLRIDPGSRSVRIEPGVTYGQLVPQLREQGLRLSLPFLPRANKSVVTSRLEREPTLIPKYQYDYMDPLLTLELVYGTGEDFRTGSACGPGTLETLKADLVNPWGPGSIDYFRLVSAAQGTMGLVTWAVTKAEVLPSLQKISFLHAQNAAELLKPIDALLRKRVVDECLVVNRDTLATMLANAQLSDHASLRESLPPWTAVLVLAGYARRAEERVALYGKALRDISLDMGHELLPALRGAEGREAELLELLSNPWTRSDDWRTRLTGNCRDLIFLAPMSRIGGLLEVVHATAAEWNYPLDDSCILVQPMVQGRGCHCEIIFPCDAEAGLALSQLQSFRSEVAERLLQRGAFFSRPYGEWAPMVYRDYPQGVDALRRLKTIFDPHQVFNPGRLCF